MPFLLILRLFLQKKVKSVNTAYQGQHSAPIPYLIRKEETFSLSLLSINHCKIITRMQKFLIPLFVCLSIGIPSLLLAQNPQSISIPPGPYNYLPQHSNATPDMLCNAAGTYTLAQFIGNSNDASLPQIFLCAGDSFLVRHNGDAVLSGDPQPSTTPGVATTFRPSVLFPDRETPAFSIRHLLPAACTLHRLYPMVGILGFSTADH